MSDEAIVYKSEEDALNALDKFQDEMNELCKKYGIGASVHICGTMYKTQADGDLFACEVIIGDPRYVDGLMEWATKALLKSDALEVVSEEDESSDTENAPEVGAD